MSLPKSTMRRQSSISSLLEREEVTTPRPTDLEGYKVTTQCLPSINRLIEIDTRKYFHRSSFDATVFGQDFIDQASPYVRSLRFIQKKLMDNKYEAAVEVINDVEYLFRITLRHNPDTGCDFHRYTKHLLTTYYQMMQMNDPQVKEWREECWKKENDDRYTRGKHRDQDDLKVLAALSSEVRMLKDQIQSVTEELKKRPLPSTLKIVTKPSTESSSSKRRPNVVRGHAPPPPPPASLPLGTSEYEEKKKSKRKYSDREIRKLTRQIMSLKGEPLMNAMQMLVPHCPVNDDGEMDLDFKKLDKDIIFDVQTYVLQCIENRERGKPGRKPGEGSKKKKLKKSSGEV